MRVGRALSFRMMNPVTGLFTVSSTCAVNNQIRALSGPPFTPEPPTSCHTGPVDRNQIPMAHVIGLHDSISIVDALKIKAPNVDFDETQHLKCLSEVLPKAATDAVVDAFKDVGREALKACLALWKDGPPADCPRGIVAMVEPFVKRWWDTHQDARDAYRDAAELSSHGINTLPEFASDMARAEGIVSTKTFHFLKQAAAMWKKWRCVQEDLMRLKQDTHKPFNLAHKATGTTKPPFVGVDRRAIVAGICESIAASEADISKEANPIHVVFGAPRMGKSRVLDEISDTVNSTSNRLAIPISFNSTTQLRITRVDEEAVKREWFSRIMYSLSYTFCGNHKSFEYFRALPVWPYISFFDVLEFAMNLTARKHITIVADEASQFFQLPGCDKYLIKTVLLQPMWMLGNFALVLSAFLSRSANVVGALSGHPTTSYELSPINMVTAGSYATLRTAAEKATSFQLYQRIRFCPGLMGLAVEGYQGSTLVQALHPPVVDHIATSYSQLFDGYWDHVANADTLIDAISIRGGLEKCEALGVVLHESRNGTHCAVLNPFFLSCFEAKVKSLEPLAAFTVSMNNWAASLWDAPRKGAVLEALLEGALRLRASYMRPMKASNFFELLSGDCVPEDCSHLVNFEGADLNAFVRSFPHHNQSTDGGEVTSKSEAQKCKANILALISGGFVARTTAKYNMGCDVVAVGSYATLGSTNGGKCCLMFETRFWEAEVKRGEKSEATRKAAIALMGILENYPTTFKRVSFVYLISCNVTDAIDLECQKSYYAGSWHTTSVSELIRQLRINKCVATVHVVHCPGGNRDPSDTFRNIMMHTLTYLVPSFELCAPGDKKLPAGTCTPSK